MKIVITPHDGLPCRAKIFSINGKEADLDDFGEVKKGELGRYQCELSGFAAKMPSTAMLNKYQITVDEYAEIVEKLNAAFDYGTCGWCM